VEKDAAVARRAKPEIGFYKLGYRLNLEEQPKVAADDLIGWLEVMRAKW